MARPTMVWAGTVVEVGAEGIYDGLGGAVIMTDTAGT